MSERYQIQWIAKTDRYDPHDRICGIGGRTRGGRPWYLPHAQAVDGIERGQWSFYVSRGITIMDVVVADDRSGHKYLKTTVDGRQPSQLLTLPDG